MTRSYMSTLCCGWGSEEPEVMASSGITLPSLPLNSLLTLEITLLFSSLLMCDSS